MRRTGHSRGAGEGVEPLLFAAATLAAAFLIFVVQPMVGKRILPWFGGAPAVWSVCLAFYQTTLFAGYAYAHALIRLASPRAQVAVHGTLLALACAVLPVLPGDQWRPTGVERPIGEILMLLGVHVGLPFLALAATGPLVGVWWARRHADRSPYPLYAVSNAGSLLALVGYPLVLEPRLPLSITGAAWSVAFVLTGVAVLGCALLAWRGGTSHLPSDPAPGAAPARPGLLRLGGWMGLSGAAVVLLMGVTNKITLDVASAPFLWILPLAAYLLSFILCFATEHPHRRPLWTSVSAAAFGAAVLLPLWRDALGIPRDAFFLSAVGQVPAYCLLLFGTCMLLHGELHRSRPAPGGLTAFYLAIAGGGAAGGLAVGLGAPLVFDDYYELPLGLAAVVVAIVAACATDPGSFLNRGRRGVRRLAVATAAGAALLYAGTVTASGWDGLVHRERSFFGVLRVSEGRGDGPGHRRLASGSTVHGVELLAEGGSRVPTAYYGRATGIGLAMGPPTDGHGRHVGVVGLGIGTLCAYGGPGDVFRFYEIDPAVVRIARDERWFSYLRDCRAEVDVVLGDARIRLDEERQGAGRSRRFDWLVLDAFTSDAIPIHLLTREAFAIWAEALAPDGVLAVHVSNRHFDLMPLIARLGFEAGLGSLLVESAHAPALRSHQALWVLLSRDEETLHGFEARMRRRARAMGLPGSHLGLTRPLPVEVASVPLWTDDYSDLLGLLRLR